MGRIIFIYVLCSFFYSQSRCKLDKTCVEQQIVMGAIDYLIRTASGGELWIIVVVIGRISLSFVHGSKINMWVINWISNCKMASITPFFFS